MTMEELVQKLNLASEAYYNGKEIMSDYEWNSLFNQLQELESKEGRVLENSPTQNVGATAVDKLEKFTHTYPAKSLDKTKDIDLLIQKFAEGIVESGSDNDKVVVMYKEDGSTAQAYYNKGRLAILVTRGNGEVGNIVTHNARNIQGLPVTIPYKGELVVRGEVLMSYSEFSRINLSLSEDQKFRNPRNLASATLTMLDSEEAAERHLHFKAFNLVHISDEVATFYPQFKLADSFSDRLNLLDHLGFSTVDRQVCELAMLRQTADLFTSNVSMYEYPVDGLVVAMDNYQYTRKLKGTEHHPHILSGYALKWADEEQETILRQIEWSPSRTGLMNPVAIFDTVEIDGTMVSRASIHNVSILREMNLKIGDRITVIKSNMIIPMIVSNLDKDSHPTYTDDELMDLVGYCPTCGEKIGINKSTEGVLTAFCPNSNCPEKMIGKLAHFCSRDCMNIDGMSEETIKKLIDAGFVKEYSDFFNLNSKPQIQYMPGFGIQSWNNMCEAADKAKRTNFVNFFCALSIPNIGKGQLKILKTYLNTNYQELAAIAGADSEGYNLGALLSALGHTGFDFSVIDGFGSVLAKDLSTWLKEKFDFFDNALSTPEKNVYGYMEFTDTPAVAISSSSIAGKNFCITGKLINFLNRQELVAKIESLGGKFVDSVSSKTDYLINNDTTSTSGKNKKAKELNIPIISEQDFLTMIQ